MFKARTLRPRFRGARHQGPGDVHNAGHDDQAVAEEQPLAEESRVGSCWNILEQASIIGSPSTPSTVENANPLLLDIPRAQKLQQYSMRRVMQDFHHQQ